MRESIGLGRESLPYCSNFLNRLSSISVRSISGSCNARGLIGSSRCSSDSRSGGGGGDGLDNDDGLSGTAREMRNARLPAHSQRRLRRKRPGCSTAVAVLLSCTLCTGLPRVVHSTAALHADYPFVPDTGSHKTSKRAEAIVPAFVGSTPAVRTSSSSQRTLCRTCIPTPGSRQRLMTLMTNSLGPNTAAAEVVTPAAPSSSSRARRSRPSSSRNRVAASTTTAVQRSLSFKGTNAKQVEAIVVKPHAPRVAPTARSGSVGSWRRRPALSQQSLSPPSSVRTLDEVSSTPAAAAAASSTTRLEFVKQGSTIIALVAATSGLLVPDRPATAAPEFESSAAASAKTKGTTMPTAVGNELLWLDEDSGTVSSRLSEVDETFGPGFVTYLARFLLNYDEGCREYFNDKLDLLVPRRDGSHIWEEFRGFAASVGLGLHRFRGPQGVRELCESLSKKYTLEQRDGATQQLAMLFSLLPPGVQPVSTVRSLLSFPMAGASMFRTVKSTPVDDVDLPSTLGESPSALLPKDLRPEYDEGLKAYFIPGIPRQMEESDLALAFGGRGPFPISKERRLKVIDFALFAACGAVGCTSTHLTVIPLDVVKTRLQTEPGRYKGLAQGVTTIAREEGWPMLMQGLGPTLAGYFWYGITVYPGYELFKRLFIGLVGPLNAALFRVPLVLAAGAAATCFACIGVCPAEAVRIRQVADPSVGDMPTAIKQIVSESGWGTLYDGLPSILFRQISFGMMKFLVFDFFTEFAYSMLPFLAEQTSTQLSVSLTSGLVAGVCAAIVSQPADTVLSTMNRDPGRGSIARTLNDIVKERGIQGLFLGLQSRIVWSGAIISGQFLLYDVCKTALHVSVDDLRVFLDVIGSAGL